MACWRHVTSQTSLVLAVSLPTAVSDLLAETNCRCYFVMVQSAQAMTGSCNLQLSTLSGITGSAIVVIMMQSAMPIAVPNVIKIIR